MKISKEIINGFYIFLAIALFFLLLEVLNLSHLFYLRLLNVLFIFYGVNRTLKQNLAEGKTSFLPNAVSAMITSFTGVVLSITALLIYSYARGGDAYVKSLSEAFMFGGDPSVETYFTGARQNNLKNVSLEIPKNKITIFTGVSGSVN